MKENPWVIVDLLHGWSSVEHFPPPMYRRMPDDGILLRGIAVPPESGDVRAFRLPEEYSDLFDGPEITTLQYDSQVVRSRVDEEGYVCMWIEAPTLKSKELFDAGIEMMNAAGATSKEETARSEARVAMLKAAQKLKEAGDEEGHDRLLAEVRRSQELDGIRTKESDGPRIQTS